VDIANWGALARPTPAISQPFNLLASLKALGGKRALAEDLAHLPVTIGRRRSVGLAGSFHRCQLRTGEKGGSGVGKTKRGKGSKWMVVVDGQGIPLGGTITSASPAEVRLAEETLETIKVPRQGRGRPKSRPQRLIGDKAYDSDKLRANLAGKGIRLLVPYRRNRKNKKPQPEVEERYRHRWKIERTFAWLGNFRRLVVRYERLITVYSGFFHLACIIIALRQF
jgi:transposase